jgi:uncharacterized protein
VADSPGPQAAASGLEEGLRAWIAGCPAPVLAYSGGVDSSYLLAVLREVLGAERVLAVLGVSPALSARQQKQAREVAWTLGVALEEVPTGELERPGYRANLGDRCFFCKDTLFAAIRARHPHATLLDGTHAEDLGGHRPGLQAAQAHGVRSPLAELGFSKAAIRAFSRARGLQTADLPASPCLASRVPAGEPVSPEALRRIEAAEEILGGLGFGEFRVRHHGALARIEVPREEIPRLVEPGLRDLVAARLRELGYHFVTLDMEGFRSGSSALPVPDPELKGRAGPPPSPPGG